MNGCTRDSSWLPPLTRQLAAAVVAPSLRSSDHHGHDAGNRTAPPHPHQGSRVDPVPREGTPRCPGRRLRRGGPKRCAYPHSRGWNRVSDAGARRSGLPRGRGAGRPCRVSSGLGWRGRRPALLRRSTGRSAGGSSPSSGAARARSGCASQGRSQDVRHAFRGARSPAPIRRPVARDRGGAREASLRGYWRDSTA